MKIEGNITVESETPEIERWKANASDCPMDQHPGPRKAAIGVIQYFGEKLDRAVEGSTTPGAQKAHNPEDNQERLGGQRVDMVSFEIKR
ncbi:hypothetical protein AtubIFM57258_006717 [Aspergillus tubingensis]|nr:hypothetical protein AtubIFM57258_006717 [Aspergillus tubingensis]